jgi:hypothetical protein
VLQQRIREAYWAAFDQAVSPKDGESRLRALIEGLGQDYPSAAACLAEDPPFLCAHLDWPLHLRKRLRSTNLLERLLKEVKRRTKVIGAEWRRHRQVDVETMAKWPSGYDHNWIASDRPFDLSKRTGCAVRELIVKERIDKSR